MVVYLGKTKSTISHYILIEKVLFLPKLINKTTMKTIWFGLTLLIVGSTLTVSCKKKGCTDSSAINYNDEAKKDDGSCEYDVSKPTISIIGANPATVALNGTYTDEGATAVNFDGTSVTVQTDESNVNTSIAGSYEVIYTASNDNGTSTAVRQVNVVMDQSTYLGTYDNTSDCDALQFPLISPSTVIEGLAANELLIDNAFNLVGGQILLQINGSNITVPFQTINITVGDIEVSGSGVMNSTGTEMTITFDYNNTTIFIGDSGTCTGTFTKQ